MAKNKNRFRYKKFFSQYFEDAKEYLETNKELANKIALYFASYISIMLEDNKMPCYPLVIEAMLRCDDVPDYDMLMDTMNKLSVKELDEFVNHIMAITCISYFNEQEEMDNLIVPCINKVIEVKKGKEYILFIGFKPFTLLDYFEEEVTLDELSVYRDNIEDFDYFSDFIKSHSFYGFESTELTYKVIHIKNNKLTVQKRTRKVNSNSKDIKKLCSLPTMSKEDFIQFAEENEIKNVESLLKGK